MRALAIPLVLFLASGIAWFHIDFVGYVGEVAGDWVFKLSPSLPDPVPSQEEIARQRWLEDGQAPTWFLSNGYIRFAHESPENPTWAGPDFWHNLILAGRLLLPVIGLTLIAFRWFRKKP